jgi:hypothetical protein
VLSASILEFLGGSNNIVIHGASFWEGARHPIHVYDTTSGGILLCLAGGWLLSIILLHGGSGGDTIFGLHVFSLDSLVRICFIFLGCFFFSAYTNSTSFGLPAEYGVQ